MELTSYDQKWIGRKNGQFQEPRAKYLLPTIKEEEEAWQEYCKCTRPIYRANTKYTRPCRNCGRKVKLT